MDDSQPPQQSIPSAPYPAPPPFWRYFTTANLERLRAIQQEHDNTIASSTDQPISPRNLPTELRYLVPPDPPPPGTEKYRTFNTEHAIDQTPQPPPQSALLFNPNAPHINLKALLHALTSSLLVNFLELTTVLSVNPAQHKETIEEMEKIFINCHYIINMYRPRQTREEIIKRLEQQVRNGEEEIERCHQVAGKVREFLEAVKEGRAFAGDQRRYLEPSRADLNGESVGNTVDQRQKEQEQALWRAIREQDGE